LFFAMHEYALRGRVIAPSKVLYIDSPSRPKTPPKDTGPRTRAQDARSIVPQPGWAQAGCVLFPCVRYPVIHHNPVMPHHDMIANL